MTSEWNAHFFAQFEPKVAPLVIWFILLILVVIPFHLVAQNGQVEDLEKIAIRIWHFFGHKFVHHATERKRIFHHFDFDMISARCIDFEIYVHFSEFGNSQISCMQGSKTFVRIVRIDQSQCDDI